MPCEKTTRDGKVRCQGTVAHRGPCFFGGVTLADFDRAAETAALQLQAPRNAQALRELIDAWQEAPIYVTGEGAKRFLDALHDCETVVDSWSNVSPARRADERKG